MAARDAPEREPAASQHAMLVQCLDRVIRARRQMTAMRRHERRQHELIETHRACKDSAGQRVAATAARRHSAAPHPCTLFRVRAPLLPLAGKGIRIRASGLRHSGPPFRGIGVQGRAPRIPRGEESCAAHTTRNSIPERIGERARRTPRDRTRGDPRRPVTRVLLSIPFPALRGSIGIRRRQRSASAATRRASGLPPPAPRACRWRRWPRHRRCRAG